MTTQINITTSQVDAAKKEIREWFPGANNAGIRKKLRAQLQTEVDEANGTDFDPMWPVRIKLGYGFLFINGSGGQRTKNFNADVNKALGLQ